MNFRFQYSHKHTHTPIPVSVHAMPVSNLFLWMKTIFVYVNGIQYQRKPPNKTNTHNIRWQGFFSVRSFYTGVCAYGNRLDVDNEEKLYEKESNEKKYKMKQEQKHQQQIYIYKTDWFRRHRARWIRASNINLLASSISLTNGYSRMSFYASRTRTILTKQLQVLSYIVGNIIYFFVLFFHLKCYSCLILSELIWLF